MNIKFSINYGDWKHHAERTIDTHDFSGIIEDFNKVLDLRELRAEKIRAHRLIREVADDLCGCLPHQNGDSRECTGKCSAGMAREFLGSDYTPLQRDVVQDPPRDDGPHGRVFEYDGSYKCLDCTALWGALPGRPTMPATCEKPIPKPTPEEELRALKVSARAWLEFGPPDPHGPACGCDPDVGFEDPECVAYREIKRASREVTAE